MVNIVFVEVFVMPHYCCAYECNSSSDKNPELCFFEVPKEKKQKKSWEERISREDWKPSKYTTICSRHFAHSDISPPNPNTPIQFQKKKLKKGTLPKFNLRGEKFDERVEKRISRTSRKARNEEQNECLNASITLSDTSEASSSCENLTFPFEEAMATSSNQDDDLVHLQIQVQTLREQLHDSQRKVTNLEKEVQVLNSKLFRYINLTAEQIQAYTNMSKDSFSVLSAYLDRFNPITYWSGSTVNTISHDDQLLICLMKLKFNLPLYDLADRYTVTRTTITNIYMTYLHLLHEVLFKAILNKIPSVEKNKSCLPDSFGDFSNCRIIIDCTEFNIEKPRTKLNTASLLFSNYKHNLTAKYLIGVAPNGSITYISDGYMGSISDKMVTDDSGVLNHLKAGDLILADKGFLLHDIVPRGVFLNLPAFLRGKKQFTKEEAIFSRKIARSRIHVERAIERMRNYTILEKIFAKERWYCDTIVQVCGALVNLQSPLIDGVFKFNDGNDIDFAID